MQQAPAIEPGRPERSERCAWAVGAGREGQRWDGLSCGVGRVARVWGGLSNAYRRTPTTSLPVTGSAAPARTHRLTDVATALRDEPAAGRKTRASVAELKTIAGP
jgi:hypothetical protein